MTDTKEITRRIEELAARVGRTESASALLQDRINNKIVGEGGDLIVGASPTDHGSLLGLADDDHIQYVSISLARTISAQHQFAPAAPAAPFTLGANASGQLVTGLNADLLDGLHSTAFYNITTEAANTIYSGPVSGGDANPTFRLMVEADVANHDMILSHTAAGLITGTVVRATGPTTFAWQQLQHGDLSGVGPTDHHNQIHDITGGDHTVIGSQWDLVGLTSTNTLDIITPSAAAGIGTSILKTSTGGELSISAKFTARNLELTATQEGEAALINAPSANGGFRIGVEDGSGDVNLYWAAYESSGTIRGSSSLSDPVNIQMDSTGPGVTVRVAPAPALDDDPITWENVIELLQDDIVSHALIEPDTTMELDLGRYNKKWQTLYVGEIYAETLVAQDVMATIGGRILVAPSTRLIADVNVPDTTMDVVHNNISSGDFCIMQTAPLGLPQVEVVKVTSGATPIAGGYRYTIVRNQDGSGTNSWVAGDGVVNLGGSTTTSGYIDITSTQTTLSDLGPNITIYDRTGTVNWNDLDPTVALGNLESFVDYASETMGLALGNDLDLTPTTGFKGITADNTNGLRMFNTDIELYNGATQTVSIQNDGNAWFGTAVANKTFQITTTGANAGDVEMGDYSGGNGGVLWDESDNKFRVDGEISVGSFPSPPNDSFLYAYWGANQGSGDDLLDESGQGFDAVVTGPGNHSWINGVAGTALSIDSSEYAILLTDAQADTFQNLCSISFWFKCSTISGDPSARVMTRDSSDYWAFIVQQNEAFPQDFTMIYSSTQNHTVNNLILSDTWHHVVMMWDVSSNIFKLYFDSVIQIDITDHASFVASTRDIVIGVNLEAVPQTIDPFDGSIDEIRVYTKLLSDLEVMSLYLDPSGLGGTTIGPGQITTPSLSAISADLGSVTAGTVTGATIRTGTGARVEMNGTRLFGTDGVTVQWEVGGADGKFVAGGGTVILDEDGMTLKSPDGASGNDESRIKWVETATPTNDIFAIDSWYNTSFNSYHAEIALQPRDEWEGVLSMISVGGDENATLVLEAESRITSSGLSRSDAFLRLIATETGSTSRASLHGNNFTGLRIEDTAIATATDPSALLQIEVSANGEGAKIGDVFTGRGGQGSGSAHFCHWDFRASGGGYAIIQSSAGDTYVNAASTKKVYIRNNNTDVAQFTSTGLEFEIGSSIGGAWTALSFGTNWSNYGLGFESGEYKIVGDMVFLRGLVECSAAWASNTLMATLPVNYRPQSRVVYWAAQDANTSGRIDITSAGALTWVSNTGGSTTGWISINGISFSVD